MDTGHRQVEHTADVAVELWAETEEGLLAEGARALIEIMTQAPAPLPAPAGEARDRRTISVDAIDPEDRLVQFLNEVLVLAVTEGYLFAGADIALREDGLDAEITGVAGAADRIETELKSVTYHDLHIDRSAGRVATLVVVDV